MRTWIQSAGVFFASVLAVYGGQATVASAADEASSGTRVRLLEDGQPSASPQGDKDTLTTRPTAGDEPGETGQAKVDVGVDGLVEVHVADAQLTTVLRMLGRQAHKNIVPSRSVRGVVTADFYGVTLREALDAILHVNGFAYRESGNFIYVYSVQELADLQRAERKITTETFQLYYTPASNALSLIQPVLSADARTAVTAPAMSGLEEGGKRTGGNDHASGDLLVVSDYPDNLERVRAIIKEVDRRPQQVLIEATILRAALNDENKLGVDFAVVGGIDFSTLTSANMSPPAAGTGFDQTLDGRITKSDNMAARTAVDKGVIAGTFGGGGLQLGVIKNNIGMFISALESVTDTVILANPKILALNKQPGEIVVGREDGYKNTTSTETTTSESVEFLKTGTILRFRPFIGGDGYIRMEIHPEDSTGGLTEAQLPYKITTQVTSNVMVKDGHTIVIGGLFREFNQSTRSQTPFMGNLPVVGPLFRKQTDQAVREEVIILLTPHIVHDDAAYAKLSAEEMRKFEQLRIGVRRGMMPWGRERLAEIEYNWAVDEMNKPQPNVQRALWHLNAATNLNPQFHEAISLKQELTGKVLGTTDSSSVRSFVQRAILADLDAPGDGGAQSHPAPPTMEQEPATQPSDDSNAMDDPVSENGPIFEDSIEFAGLAGAPTPEADTRSPSVVVTELPLDEMPGQR